MATYNTVRVDIDRLRQVILEEGDDAMQLAIVSNFGVLEYFGDFNYEDITLTSVDYKVNFNDIRAWVMFFGRGQGITHDNPFLEDYIENSGLWADKRPRSGAVVKRGSDSDYWQYDYSPGANGGVLKHYDQGADDAGDLLEPWQQKLLRMNPRENFWETIEKTYTTFVSNFSNIAIPNINRRSDEYIKIDSKTI